MSKSTLLVNSSGLKITDISKNKPKESNNEQQRNLCVTPHILSPGPSEPTCHSFFKSACIIKPGQESEEVIGHDNVVEKVIKTFLLFQHSDRKIDSQLITSTILLCGIPGVGKTLLMKSIGANVATMFGIQVALFVASTSDLVSKFIGESEKLVSTLLDTVQKSAPSILMLDEVDGLMSSRNDNEHDSTRRFKTHLLSELEGKRKWTNVMIVASTNRGHDLDSAFLRRFKSKFYMPPPTPQERVRILDKYLKMAGTSVSEILDAKHLAKFMNESNRLTGSDIQVIVSKALEETIRVVDKGKLERPCATYKLDIVGSSIKIIPITHVRQEDIFAAMRNVKPSHNEREMQKIRRWAIKYCQSSSSRHESVTEEKRHTGSGEKRNNSINICNTQ